MPKNKVLPRFGNRKPMSWRYINELQGISKRLGMFDIQESGRLFDLSGSQKDVNELFSKYRFQDNMDLQRKQLYYNQRLGKRELESIPTKGEAFWNAVIPSAVNTGANLYEKYRLGQNRNTGDALMRDYINQVNYPSLDNMLQGFEWSGAQPSGQYSPETYDAMLEYFRR